MTNLEFAEDLAAITGNKDALSQHLAFYEEFLPHVFFSDEIETPLSELLLTNSEKALIQKYIDFVETMWFSGDDAVQNVVCVTLVEQLGDDDVVWENFASYLSDKFRPEVDIMGRENILGRPLP